MEISNLVEKAKQSGKAVGWVFDSVKWIFNKDNLQTMILVGIIIVLVWSLVF